MKSKPNYLKFRKRLLKNLKPGVFLWGLLMMQFLTVNNTIAAPTEKLAVAQSLRITGTVTDASTGEALAGVNIAVEGTTIGVIAGTDGKYSIEVPSQDATLLFSYIGYLTEKIAVQGKSQIDVKLVADVKKLDEVVVVGYGTQRKSTLAGSVTSIKSSDISGNVNGSNAAEALAGKAGIFVTSTGTPGSAPTVRIRGVGTNGNANPTYVVDGMMVDNIDFLNPEDIQSMDILKDASATAIYGSRAANGVIMVTTKKGKEGHVIVNYSFNEGFDFYARKFDLGNATQYAQIVNNFYDNNTNPSLVIPYYDLSTISGNSTNWVDEVSNKNAHNQEHQLSVNGGTEKINYNLSVGYLKVDGILNHIDYDRWTARVNNDYKLNKFIKIGHNLSIANYNTGYPIQYTFMRSVYGASPLVSPKNSSGAWNSMQDASFINPAAELELNKDYNQRNLRFVGNVWGELEIIKGLAFRTSYGRDLLKGYLKYTKPIYNINSSYQSNLSNYLQEYYNTSDRWLWDNTLTYDKKLGEHKFNAVIGMSAEKTTTNEFGTTATGFSTYNPDYMTTYSAAAANRTVLATTIPSKYTKASYFGRINYSYKDKYLFTATYRADGSSKFGFNNQYGYFPSVAAGWRVTQEEFMKSLAWLNNLKIRASWGRTGNDNIPNGTSYNLVTENAEDVAVFNGSAYGSGSIRNANNPNIKWEESEQTDLGADLVLLDSKLSFEFDWFNKETKNLIFQYPAPGVYSSGLGLTNYNAGTVRNRGIEFTTHWNDDKKEFKYGASLSVSAFTNKVTDWAGQQTLGSGAWWAGTISQVNIKAGEPFNYFFGYKVIGIYQNQSDLDTWNNYAVSKGKTVYQSGAVLGDAIVQDGDGDGVITSSDQTNIGNPYPKATGTFSFYASYKGFDMKADFSGQTGGKVMNLYYSYMGTAQQNMSPDWIDSWTPGNTEATLPRLSISSYIQGKTTSINVFSSDYVKLQGVELGYTLPKSLISKLKLEKLRIYVGGTNLLYLTKYKGFTPEIYGGIDANTYPIYGTYKMGLLVTF